VQWPVDPTSVCLFGSITCTIEIAHYDRIDDMILRHNTCDGSVNRFQRAEFPACDLPSQFKRAGFAMQAGNGHRA
jgi:hypothetical protein